MSAKQTAIVKIQAWDSQMKKFFTGPLRYLKIAAAALMLIIGISLLNDVINWFLWILLASLVGALAYVRDQPQSHARD